MTEFNIVKQRRRLGGVEVADRSFTGADMRHAVAQASTWIRCIFWDTNFDMGAFGDATFLECKFFNCSFRGATLVSRLYHCEFTKCDFDTAIFAGADIKDTDFIRCRAEYSVWDRATLIRVRMDCALHGARLDFAETSELGFVGSNLWGALVPINCAMFLGSEFDERSVQLFMGLLARTTGNDELRKTLLGWVDPKWTKLVGRLVSSQGGA